MEKKVALFAFNGEAMCFVHVLLNALDMKERGMDATLVIEGAATRLIPEFTNPASPLKPLYDRAAALGLVGGVCKACANKMGALEAATNLGLPLLNDMSGHPSLGRYMALGYEVLTF